MPRVIYIIVMAIIQGITEFLPISSSGHLVLAGAVFGLDEPGAGLEIALHFGTLISIVLFYRREIANLLKPLASLSSMPGKKSLRTLGLIAIATIPAVIVGLIFENGITRLFDNTSVTSIMLLVTAAILASTAFQKMRGAKIGPLAAIAIGLSQALAILPGISRSGATIAMGRHLGISGNRAAKFSFLMAIPIIAGAAIFQSIRHVENIEAIYLVGIAVSAAVGYLSLKLLIALLNSGKFWVFAPYCAAVGIIGLVFL